jgi:hypothetical protein
VLRSRLHTGAILVPHFLFTITPKRSSPTLWPFPHETPAERAVQACEQENELLKSLVINLSEFILRDAAGKN